MQILTLSTYPIDEPLHGGQHRLVNIVAAYVSMGHTVSSAGVLGSESYAMSEGFVSYPGMNPMTPYIENPFLMDDWAIGKLFSENDTYFNALSDCIKEVPDLIHVEQPWLFSFAVRYRSLYPSKSIKILYGSQNIEHDMKFDIVNTYMGEDFARAAEDRVLECELNAIHSADGICCVSQHDLEWTQNHTNKQCVLAQNGVRERTVSDAGTLEANRITGNRKICLYSASAHPPNITGFFDMFGNGIGCISPESRIVIAGSAGPNIFSDKRCAKTAGLERAGIPAGTVSEACLASLLNTAHCIILPITHGGGTNLKTAEALWAGKHIVATSKAMRGFETYSSAKGVLIADNSRDFSKALLSCMTAPPNRLTADEYLERRAVLWSEILMPLQILASNL